MSTRRHFFVAGRKAPFGVLRAAFPVEHRRDGRELLSLSQHEHEQRLPESFLAQSSLPSPDKSGGLKGWMQHWLAVYPPEFEIPTFFVAADSDAERSRPAPTASSRTDPLSSTGI